MNTPLLNDIAPPRNAFVLPQHKIVYMPVTKVACSSLRWMVADLVGEDFTRFYRASGSHQSRLMTIHSTRVDWEFAPRLDKIPDELLAEISPDNGWFVFSAVRDPWTRLWSAWQSKLLVQHTPYVREYGDEPWFPRIPAKPSDILDDWLRFVETAPWKTHPGLHRDPHFRSQYATVRPKNINYTKIYDLHDMSNLFADIHRHLRGLGLDKELYTPRANENPVPMTADALEHGVADRVRTLYKRDFANFGDRWDLETIRLAPGPLTMDAVNAIAIHASANQRIGDLSAELKRALAAADGPKPAPAVTAAPAVAPTPAASAAPSGSPKRAPAPAPTMLAKARRLAGRARRRWARFRSTRTAGGDAKVTAKRQ